MKCCVDGCDRDASYKEKQLCQMHYFRVWRNATTELVRPTAKPRIEDRRGYQFLHAPTHPLRSSGQSYVAEHRVLMYEKLGPGAMCCELCGVEMTWKTCQIDHIDENPRNNALSNLRPLCRRCNVWRNMPPTQERLPNVLVLTAFGETKTAGEWAKDPRVSIWAATIKRRKRAGASDMDAIFGEKKTHHGRGIKKYERKPRIESQRSNAVAITYGGKTLTAAEWAREPGVTATRAGIVYRVRQGWPAERVLYSPNRNCGQSRQSTPQRRGN